MGTIAENIEAVRARIGQAAARSGRDARDIRLICVTKSRAPSEIGEAIAAGEYELGENRAQEFLEKYDTIQDIALADSKKPNIMWNFIGQLQRNKVKYLAGKISLIHSVDSFKLAEEIDARAQKAGEPAGILIQMNTAGEKQKSGVALSESEALVNEIEQRLSYVKVQGLMAVVPDVLDPEDVRGYFRDARRTFEALAEKRGGAEADFKHLSMGMTHDFEIAVEEGATIVRVGTAIFGPRGSDHQSV